jgi:hypothetical protein
MTTIRQHVERRGMLIRYLAIVWIVVMFIAVFVFPERFALVEWWQAMCYYIPLFLLYFIFAATTKCPRCNASLGMMIEKVANPFSSDVPNQCPGCGVSFAERMDGRSKLQ